MQQMIIPQSFVIYVTIKMEDLPLKYNFDGDEVFSHLNTVYRVLLLQKFTHFCFC